MSTTTEQSKFRKCVLIQSCGGFIRAHSNKGTGAAKFEVVHRPLMAMVLKTFGLWGQLFRWPAVDDNVASCGLTDQDVRF